MDIRKTTIHEDGKIYRYWALVESYRTKRGPRQRIVTGLGEMDEAGGLGVGQVAEGTPGYQRDLFEKTEPEWVEIHVKRVRVENVPRSTQEPGSGSRHFYAGRRSIS